MAFSHIRDDISSKQEDRFYHFSPMVELAKACPNNYVESYTLLLAFCM